MLIDTTCDTFTSEKGQPAVGQLSEKHCGAPRPLSHDWRVLEMEDALEVGEPRLIVVKFNAARHAKLAMQKGNQLIYVDHEPEVLLKPR